MCQNNCFVIFFLVFGNQVFKMFKWQLQQVVYQDFIVFFGKNGIYFGIRFLILQSIELKDQKYKVFQWVIGINGNWGYVCFYILVFGLYILFVLIFNYYLYFEVGLWQFICNLRYLVNFL